MSRGILYTCDLICYGVASPVAFQDYISFLEKHSGKAVKQYIHRGFGLKTGEGAKIVYEDGTVEQDTLEANLWSCLWYHYLVRESCYSCKYHSLDRPGNITIGDYWGVEKVLPGLKDEWGVSCILVNDEQGLALLDQAKEHLELHKTSVSDVANAAQPMLFKQPEDDRQNIFWKAYDKGGFEGACASLGFLSRKKSFEEIRRIVKSIAKRIAERMVKQIVKRKAPMAPRSFASALREKASVNGEVRNNELKEARTGVGDFKNGDGSSERDNEKSECSNEPSEVSRQGNFPLAYAAKHSSEATRKQSSSGGVFYALAQTVINQGGVVYGCAFDENHKAQHIRCETMDEAVCCMGSKYSQSDLGDSLEKANEDINAGRNVLFTGTPCQIAAVRAVCEKLKMFSLSNKIKKVTASKASNTVFVGATCQSCKEASGVEIPKLFNSAKECCGCTACMTLCPQGAIEMRADSKGFAYPHIISNLCTGCIKCISSCSFQNKLEDSIDYLCRNERKEEECR